MGLFGVKQVKMPILAAFPALPLLHREGTETGRTSSGAGLNGSARDHTLCAPCARLIALPFPLHLPLQEATSPETLWGKGGVHAPDRGQAER